MKTFLRWVCLATTAGLLAAGENAFAQDTNTPAPTVPPAPTGLTVTTDTTSTNAAPEKPKKKKKKKAATTDTARADSKAISGDVTKVDNDAKTLSVADHDKAFTITSKTRITKDGEPAILADIVPGDHVTIHAKDDATGNPSATSVRVGKAKTKRTKKAKAQIEGMTNEVETAAPATAPGTTPTSTATPESTPAPTTPPATPGGK